MRLAIIIGPLLAAGLAGCGGDSATTADFGGWYQVTSAQQGDCGMLADSPMPPAYVWVEPFSGIYYVNYCTGTAETDCNAKPFYDFTQPITDGWAASGGSAFFSAECTLFWERTEATVVGDVLHIHALHLSVVQAIPEADCTLAAAEALTTPCTYEIDVTATRL